MTDASNRIVQKLIPGVIDLADPQLLGSDPKRFEIPGPADPSSGFYEQGTSYVDISFRGSTDARSIKLEISSSLGL